MSGKTLTRKTKETQVELRGGEAVKVDTGLPFFDHMLGTLLRYAGLNLELRARGDLRHHLIEDVGISLGLFLKDAIPATARRYGERIIPMDDALVQAVVDVGGRSYYRGKLPNALYEHFLRSLAENARITLHVRRLRGRDRHHLIEASFKAVGLALRDACSEGGVLFSTKGAVELEVT
ncbi:MAG: imidazoleglycerol-phosphate dehydratase [Myxococcota bacterium]|nr:imidazoleglycerol-phosphate dehydratase [Myxococcota bacterium]